MKSKIKKTFFFGLGELVYDVLADQPLIQPEIIILSKTELDVKNVKVEDKRLLTELDCSLVVGSQILQRSNVSPHFLIRLLRLSFDFLLTNRQL